MVFLSLAGILQALFLPGLAIILWSTRRHSIHWIDKVLFATPLSIAFNYGAVILLVWLEYYTQAIMLALIALEALAILIYAYRHAPSGNTVLRFSFSTRLDIQPLPLVLMFVAFLCLLIVFLVSELHEHFVFTGWDPVVSWNRWAKNWYDQNPVASWGYPPGLPILYSIVYKTIGISNVQIMAKIMVCYFPFFGLFCLWRTCHIDDRFQWAGLIGGIVYVFLISRFSLIFPFSGYTDPVIASLGAFCLYALLLMRRALQKTSIPAPGIALGALFVISASSASLIKQTGVALALCTAGIACLIYGKRWLQRPGKAFALLLFSAVIAAHWYVYSYVRWNDFAHATSLMPAGMLSRLSGALRTTVQTCGLFVCIATAAGCVIHPMARRIALLFVLPLWIFWAVMASYDFRSAYGLIPGVALIAGFGIEAAALRLNTRSYAFCKRKLIQYGLPIAIGLLVIVLLNLPGKNWILTKNHEGLRKTADQGFNEYLEKIFDLSNSNEKMLSCWQLPYNLPNASGKFLATGNCETPHVLWLNSPGIKYFLFRPPDDGAQADNKAEEVRQAARSANIPIAEKKLSKGFILFGKNPPLPER